MRKKNVTFPGPLLATYFESISTPFRNISGLHILKDFAQIFQTKQKLIFFVHLLIFQKWESPGGKIGTWGKRCVNSLPSNGDML